jgi:molecular chaperone GrpE
MNKKAQPQPADTVTDNQAHELDELIEKLHGELELAREKERRAVADYQNLVRRSREEKIKIAKFATLDFVETILDPLSHLSLAAEQLNDQGLNMVISQLWMRLNEAGLEEINPLGEEFDVNTMEAVADPRKKITDEDDQQSSQKVTKVIAKGYTLNGEIVRHAKVVVG